MRADSAVLSLDGRDETLDNSRNDGGKTQPRQPERLGDTGNCEMRC